jgi:hypothetical protein
VLTVLRQGTTVVPHHAVSRLVTAGPFQFTRNPMYTGHVVVLLGAALRTGSCWPLLIVPLCMQATTPLVILPEAGPRRCNLSSGLTVSGLDAEDGEDVVVVVEIASGVSGVGASGKADGVDRQVPEAGEGSWCGTGPDL